jgi:hypothetical protein
MIYNYFTRVISIYKLSTHHLLPIHGVELINLDDIYSVK